MTFTNFTLPFTIWVLLALFQHSCSKSVGLDSSKSLGNGNDVVNNIIVNTTAVGAALVVKASRQLTMTTANIRFNKFIGDPRGFKPLVATNYPVRGSVYNILTEMTDAMHVYVLNDDEVVDYDVMGIIEKLGGLPIHPEEDEHSEFWDVSFCESFV